MDKIEEGMGNLAQRAIIAKTGIFDCMRETQAFICKVERGL